MTSLERQMDTVPRNSPFCLVAKDRMNLVISLFSCILSGVGQCIQYFSLEISMTYWAKQERMEQIGLCKQELTEIRSLATLCWGVLGYLSHLGCKLDQPELDTNEYREFRFPIPVIFMEYFPGSSSYSCKCSQDSIDFRNTTSHGLFFPFMVTIISRCLFSAQLVNNMLSQL